MILTHGANSLARFVEIGGRKYRTVKIGNQLWMAENLDYKFSGCDIGPAGSPTTPAAWYYNNDETDYGIDGTYKCGLLYNGYAAKYLDDNRETLLPDGWRVASSNDWDTLSSFIGTSVAGTKLKALENSITQGFPNSSWGGTDDYGFGVIPHGSYNNSNFVDLGNGCVFWPRPTDSYYLEVRYFWAGVAEIRSYTDEKIRGYAIRLVKDAT